MNIKRKSNLNLFTVLFLIILQGNKALLSSPSADEDDDDKSLPCNRELLISMGFIGYNYSQKERLEFCPTVVQSCCTVEDQVNIYQFWIQGKEENMLELRFKYQRKVYFEYLNNIAKVKKKAKKILKVLKDKKTANCYILSKRILHFNTEEIFVKLKKAFKSMHDFFETTHKGLYCNLCDAKSQSFFDVKKGKFIMNKKFCRDITAYSLHTMIYMYIHMIKLTNLISKFVSSCNPIGQYKESIVPHRFKFDTRKKIYDTLLDCKRDRNTDYWFNTCVHLCNHFKLTSFSQFFQPHLKKIESYNKYMKQQLDRLKKEEMLIEILKIAKKKKGELKPKAKATKEKTKKTKKIKKQKAKEEKAPELINPFDKLDLYESIFESHFSLSTFKSVFKDKGMDLYGTGARTIIEDNTYDLVKMAVDENKPENEEGNEDKNEQNKQKKQSDTGKPAPPPNRTLNGTKKIETAVLLSLLIVLFRLY